MAKLTDEEKTLMQRLQAKAEAPDEPPMSKSVSFSLDLGDESQIKRAVRLGLLPGFDDDDDNSDDKEGDEKDDTPKRRGYFKDA